MALIHRVSKWADGVLHRGRLERDLDREVASYVELLAQEKIRSGMPAGEARRAALLEVEGAAQVKENVREARTGAWLEQLVGDIRYGARLLRKNLGFAVIVMLTLALGIGANTAIFSVLYSVLLKPLPYSKPGEIVRVWQASRALGFDQLGMTEGQFVSLRDQKRFFSDLGVYQFGRGFISKESDTQNVFLGQSSAGVLETLGVRPLLGRGFERQDESEGSAPVVLLSYQLWQDWYHGDPHVVGQILHINEKPMTIIGVLPEHFFVPEDFVGNETIQAWTPLTIHPAAPRWISFSLQPVARLRRGVSIEQTTAELRPYLEQLYREHPVEGNTLESMGWGLTLKNVHDDLVGGVRTALWILASAVGVILLIVCANVASLMLARSTARQKELAIRTALGAQPARIIRQLLTESLLLSLLGGTLGLLLAHWALRLIVGLAAYNVPRLDQAALNIWVLLFTAVASVLTALIFGLLPALQAAKPDVTSAMGQDGRGMSQGRARNRAQSTLVVVEVALAVVLVASAGLLLRSFEGMLRIDPGFRTHGTLTLSLDAPPARYPDSPRVAAFADRTLARVRALPGVQDAAIVSNPPLSGFGDDTVFDMEGQTVLGNMQQHVFMWQVTPGYFQTIGIPLTSGRELELSDNAGRAPAVVINEVMARRFWPNRNPLGQHVRFYSDLKTTGQWAEIVGIVRNVPMRSLTEEKLPQVFMTYAQGKQITPWTMGTTLVLRSSQDPQLLVNAIRQQVRDLDSSVVVRRPITGQELISQTVSQPHFNLVLLGLFAVAALTLAAIGIYGILANLVRQRTREIGIRLAMGARRADVFRLVVGHGMRLAGMGLVLGTMLALCATRLLSSLLVGIKPSDPLTFSSVILLLSLVAFIACYLPGRRATQVDPMITLRYE